MSSNAKMRDRLKTVLRALRHRNFRLFFIGQGISLVGTWMQSIAVSWLVYRLTQSEFMLGLVAFIGQIPILFVSPFAGVLGDRISRHRIIIAVQVLAMAQSFVLAGITLTGAIQVWHIGLLSLFLGIVNAFDMPSRQAFVIEMLQDQSDLGNAIALNSGLFNGARLVGPMVAGILVALAGEGVCFIVNGVSYLAALAALLSMNIPARKIAQRGERLFSHMKEGLMYVFGFSPIRDLLVTVSLVSLVAFAFPVLLPVFADRVLHGDSLTLGFLAASWGVGALAGTIFLASRQNVLGLGKVIKRSLFISGIGLVLFSLSQWLILSMMMLAAVGFGTISTLASCNTIVQTIVDEEKRGRVMSFYVMAVMGAAPFGSIIFGGVSRIIGAPLAVLAGGVLCLIIGLLVAKRLPSFRKIIRPIYKGMGIIPE